MTAYLVAMFILAGIVEGFVTPSYAPGAVKIILGIALGALVITYLTTAGRARASKALF